MSASEDESLVSLETDDEDAEDDEDALEDDDEEEQADEEIDEDARAVREPIVGPE